MFFTAVRIRNIENYQFSFILHETPKYLHYVSRVLIHCWPMLEEHGEVRTQARDDDFPEVFHKLAAVGAVTLHSGVHLPATIIGISRDFLFQLLFL